MKSDFAPVNLRAYLEFVAEEILLNGWIGSVKAKEMEVPSTATMAYGKLVAVLPEIYNPKPSQQAKALAAATYGWVEEATTKPNVNEYEFSLLLIFKSEMIEYNAIGFAASAVWGARRTQIKARTTEEGTATESQHVGKVGDKIKLELAVQLIKPCDGTFGRSYLHRFVDKAGNNVNWFSTQGTDMVEGKTYKVFGTVKKHDEYLGVKATILSRCRYEET
jgi:hypothetical protein